MGTAPLVLPLGTTVFESKVKNFQCWLSSYKFSKLPSIKTSKRLKVVFVLNISFFVSIRYFYCVICVTLLTFSISFTRPDSILCFCVELKENFLHQFKFYSLFPSSEVSNDLLCIDFSSFISVVFHFQLR